MKVIRQPLKIDPHMYAFDWNVERSMGCHVMPVIEEMAKRLGFEDAQKDDLPQEALDWYRFGGFINEYVMAHHLTEIEAARNPNAIFRPGEFMWCFECDDVLYPSVRVVGIEQQKVGEEHCKTHNHHGIFGTPDAIAVQGYSLQEWKCTWKTSRRAGGDNDTDGSREHITMGIWRWPQQTMAYAWAMETRRATLKAMWMNGDYKPPRPSGDQFLFEFTTTELNAAWSTLVSYARRYGYLDVPERGINL